jgi:uncharacterized NAD(P)/FAD-binding protein YdhS
VHSKFYDIAIVGGGFSGIAVAYYLAKIYKYASSKKLLPNVVLFECEKTLGGIAYNTLSPVHLLNVPANKMSIDDEQPELFYNWLKRKHKSFQPEDFVSRGVYREFLQDYFENFIIRNLNLKLENQTITSIELEDDNNLILTTKEGSFRAKNVILALGNRIVPEQRDNESNFNLLSPWEENQLTDITQYFTKESYIAVVGTGLSAVDVLLSLENLGYKGSYNLISRKGFLPNPHATNSTINSKKDFLNIFLTEYKLNNHLRKFRELVKEENLSYQTVIDELRPHLPSIWKNYTLTDKNRFLRHLRSWWDVHRHRIPASSHKQIEELRLSDRLQVIKGKFSYAYINKNLDNKKRYFIKLHGKRESLGPFDICFNCMGLWSDITKTDSPLINSLIANGLAAYDDLNLGFKTDLDGKLIGNLEEKSSNIYTLGSLRRGELWESTAVKEIRQQAAIIAKKVAKIS